MTFDTSRVDFFATFDREQAKRWLQQHMTRPCPCCAATDWSLGDRIVALLPLSAGDYYPILRPGTVAPLVMAECHGCGLTLTFNAKSMKLI